MNYYEKEQLNTITPNYKVLPTIDTKNIPESQIIKNV